VLALSLAALATLTAAPLTLHGTEGDAQAFTSLTDLSGKPLADGRYVQSVKNGVLHIESRYDFPSGRVAIERAAVRLHPLAQESWSWEEKDGETKVRDFAIDFKTGNATGKHYDKNEHWEEHFDVKPGEAWAGIAFIEVVKSLRDELAPGQKAEVTAIAMTPKPRKATVQVIHDGGQRIDMAARKIDADKFTIHPEIPAIAKLFIKVPDQAIYLVAGKPSAFLRYEGPFCEPSDPIIRVDLIASPPANGESHASHDAHDGGQ
jgi:hypothetical protein